MKTVLTFNVPLEINLEPVYGRDFKTLTFENRGTAAIYLVPRALPENAAQLPPNLAWDSNFEQAKLDFCEEFGYLLGANQRFTRSSEGGREIAIRWAALAPDTSTQVYSIVEK